MSADRANVPAFDDHGNNLADPHDRLGRKSDYIQLLQQRALEKYLKPGTGYALDVGCGLGRMGEALGRIGYSVVGLDPSLRILRAMPEKSRYAGILNASLPQLPFRDESFDLVCLFGVARMTLLLGKADICRSAPRLVKPGGQLAVIDNLKVGDGRYLQEPWFDETFARNGLRRVLKLPIRNSRWPVVYLIRYGLIPTHWLAAIAEWELKRMAKKRMPSRLSYYNYLFIYEKS